MAKGKKGAKSAVDKAAAEEAERLRLEEEARLQELRAKKERELREKQEREAFEALFNQWKRFLECSILPDPLNEPELNTYLSLWAEEPVGNEDDLTLQGITEALPNAEKLCNEIAEAISIECDNQNVPGQLNLRMQLTTMRQLIVSKWDLVTTRIMQHYDHFNVESNENFHFAGSTDNYIFGIWGNLTRNPRHKTIEYSNIKLAMTLPKPISLASVAIRMLYESGFTASAPFFYQDTDQHMSVIGGVLFLDIFEMPEAPKVMSSMAIRQILSPDGKLKYIQYPFKKTVTEAAEEEGDKDGLTDLNVWPAQISYDIFPDCFIHKESAKMMSWDDEQMCWSDENVGDVEINIESGAIKFKTTQFRPTAFVQKTYAEYPFQDWSIEPIGKSRALFVIRGSQNLLKFEVFDGKCRLITPMTDFLEKNMEGKWFTPSLFFMKLSQIGLNFTGPQSLRGIDIDPSVLKGPLMEDLAIKGIGLSAQLFAIKRSPSNKQLANAKMTLQIQQVAEGQPVSDDPAAWKTILFDSSCKIGETDQKIGFWVPDGEVTDETKFSADNQEKANLHSSVYSLIRSLVTDKNTLTVLDETDVMFSKTIFEVLQVTRLLSFSA
ncbi:UNVERIFIED_CONTAM: Protein casc1 [Siphonaria sp. JEL0065]|nr:Protein casc1 [Siphonaria sp. JEL0065]